MLLIAALSSMFVGLPAIHAPHMPNVFGRHAQAAMTVRHARVGPWRIAARTDSFGGAVACSVTAHGVSLERQTLIFRVAPRGETTRAVYRIDSAPPHPIADTFDTVQANGFFPQKGWVVDPDGGEAAIPPATVRPAPPVL